ncbi:MAG: diguanylate cyclase [Pseudomonadota bacterium]|nr:diguanylate cyclase [Pseudomonadota bacterium]
MQKRAMSAPEVAGVLVALLGSVVAIRWIFQVEAIGRLLPGSAEMGLVNPLLFIAIGISFFVVSRPRRIAGVPLGLLGWACIVALVVLPLAYLFESVTNIALGVDFVSPGTVRSASNPHPGRLSPNAALAFLLTGLAFWLLHRPPSARRTRLYLAALLGVALVGLSGLVGHFLGLETLYQIANFNRILAPTAFGFAIVAGGLWMLHDQSLDVALDRTQQRIDRRSIVVVTLVALGSGVAGFAVLRDSFEQSVSDNLLLTATTTATSLGHTVESGLWFPKAAALRPALGRDLARLDARPDDAEARGALQALADGFLTAEVTGVQFYDLRGAAIVEAGLPARPRAEVTHPLANVGQRAALAWQDGYLLIVDTDVAVGGETVGRVVIEQRLPLFDELLADVRAATAAADAAICSREGDHAVCARNKFRQTAFSIPLRDAAGRPSLPIVNAFFGERGVAFARDNRGHDIISAYVPISHLGLAFSIKTDVDTLYAPVRARLGALVAAVAAIVALAIYAQRSQVRPVVMRLVRSEQRIKSILEEQSELVSLAWPGGELVYANPAYARHLGLAPAAMIGSNLYDHVDPADRDAVRDTLARVMESGVASTTENRMVERGGAERWVSWTNSVQRDASGLAMLHSVGRDVTERKRAEFALQASRAVLERTGRVAGVGGWEVDLRSGQIAWTEETQRIHDVAAGHVPTMHEALAFYAPASRRRIAAAIDKASRDGTGWDLELAMVTATGRPIWVRNQGQSEVADGRPVRLVGALQDITARKALEQRVAENERFVRQVTDSLPALISYLDKDERFRFANEVYASWLGHDPRDLIGKTLVRLYGRETYDGFSAHIARALGGARVTYSRELVTLEGTKHVDVTLIPDVGAGGEVVGLFVMMIDVSARRQAEVALLRSERRLRMVADHIPAIVTYVDQDERYGFVNAYLGSVFKTEPERLIGKTVRETGGAELYAAIAPHIAAALRGEQVVFHGDWTIGDRIYHYQSTYIPDVDQDGIVRGYYAVTFDISALKETQHRLDMLARVDTLTGLPNRRQLDERLQEAMARTRRSHKPLALMFLDIDHFKSINDTLGHGAGDQVLKEFALRLSHQVRSTDMVARLAGDEFIILLEGIQRVEEIETLAAKIVRAVREPLALQTRVVRVTTSVGAATYTGGDETPADLLACADRALYAAKRHGRDQFSVARQGPATVLDLSSRQDVARLPPGDESAPDEVAQRDR